MDVRRRELIGLAAVAFAALKYPIQARAESSVSRPPTVLSVNPREGNHVLSINGQLQDSKFPKQLPVRTLEQDGIAECWETLFKWDGAYNYSFFFLDLPQLVVLNETLGSSYNDLEKGSTIAWRPPSLKGRSEAAIRVVIPPTMKSVQKSNQYCVAVDGFAGVALPEVAAHLCSASFATGLVARLSLHEFTTNPQNIEVGDYLKPLKATLESAAYVSPGNRQWSTFIEAISSDGAIQSAGIFDGWQAGGVIASLTGDLAKSREATWKLIQARFSWREIGELTSYALNYIVGYSRCQSVLSVVDKKRPLDLKAVHAALASDDKTMVADEAITRFFGGLVSRFGEVVSDAKASKPFSDFLAGYQAGALRASETVFYAALRLGYGIGYGDGFSAGYARGYADGYRDGYNDGTSTIAGVFKGLVEAVSDIKTAASIIGFIAA